MSDSWGTEPRPSWWGEEAHLAALLVLPALAVMALVMLFPVVWTVWDSLHLDDLRMPWRGHPFVGLANYVEAVFDPRLRGALLHTAVFVLITVTLELFAGLCLALALDRLSRLRQLVGTVVLLPWAVPTVVGALLWRFIFESPGGLASSVVGTMGLVAPTWFADPVAAWLPLVVADVWKTTPFVALLLLAGLQQIDRTLYEAADMDGANAWTQLVEVTLPLLRPALLVAFVFRTLDAFRVFDMVYVMTGGGPGTATEPVAVYTFTALLQNLRFGYGASLSTLVFVISFLFALAAVRLLGGEAFQDRPA